MARRFIIDRKIEDNEQFEIRGEEAKHIFVLRHNIGDVIEINDKTHNTKKRKDRDLKVQKICDDVNVKLIKFYTSYPNERNYILNRVINEINSK